MRSAFTACMALTAPLKAYICWCSSPTKILGCRCCRMTSNSAGRDGSWHTFLASHYVNMETHVTHNSSTIIGTLTRVTQGFVLKSLRAIYKYSFIHSFNGSRKKKGKNIAAHCFRFIQIQAHSNKRIKYTQSHTNTDTHSHSTQSNLKQSTYCNQK